MLSLSQVIYTMVFIEVVALIAIVISSIRGQTMQTNLSLSEGPPFSPHCPDHQQCDTTAEPGPALRQAGDCHCDRLCHAYDDCCHGAAETTITDDIATIIALSSCDLVGHGFYHVVNSCPSSHPKDHLRESCEQQLPEDVLNRVPVSDLLNGITFKNMFCALCHGYGPAVTRHWMLEMECLMASPQGSQGLATSQTDLTPEAVTIGQNVPNNNFSHLVDSSAFCKETISPFTERPTPRPCLPYRVDTCRAGWTDNQVQERCLQWPQAVVFVDGQPYRNVHCALCNDVMVEQVECNSTFDFPPLIIGQPPPLINVVPVSILLDFNAGTMQVGDHSRAAKDCDQEAIYDMTSHTCRPLICPPGRQLKAGHCTPVTADIHSPPGEDSCPLVMLNDDYYTVLDNGSLLINNTGHIFESSGYNRINNSVYLCENDFILLRYFLDNYEMEYVQGILSMVGLVLSICALVLLIVVYSCLKPLRTGPGLCLLCLAGSLAMAQLLFLLGMFTTTVHTLCVVIAILTHFFFLVSFFWTNVMSFDVFLTFRKQFTLTSGSRRKFRIYVAYCLLGPCLLVLLAVVAEYSHSASLPPPLYGRSFCWIGHRQALLYYFSLPIAVLLVSNVFFFLTSVYHIWRSSASGKVGNHRHGKRKRLVLYAKLSTIMGLTWLFGYIAAWTGLTVLWYFFIIFNTSQGVFICIAFLCNRKVARLLRQRFGWTQEDQTSATGSTQRTAVES